MTRDRVVLWLLVIERKTARVGRNNERALRRRLLNGRKKNSVRRDIYAP